jgi:ankyrin repeat protein
MKHILITLFVALSTIHAQEKAEFDIIHWSDTVGNPEILLYMLKDAKQSSEAEKAQVTRFNKIGNKGEDTISWDINFSSLKYALLNRNLELVKFVVEHGADVNFKGDWNGCYAIEFTLRNNDFGILKYLIEKGADIHFKNDYLFRWGIEHGNIGMVKFLIERGINVHANNDIAFVWAAKSENLEMIKFLNSIK